MSGALIPAALMLAAGFVLAVVQPARAQTLSARDSLLTSSGQASSGGVLTRQVWPQQVSPEQASPDQTAPEQTEPTATADTNDDDIKDIDVGKLDWSQLNVDASTLREPKARSAPLGRAAAEMTWSDGSQPNGVSAVSVKQAVSPFLDTRVGADMTVAPEPTTMSELLAEKTANGGSLPRSSGTAWASITAPGAGAIWDKTAVEARVDPAQEQSKLGTSLSKSVPLSGGNSLTLQDGYNVTEQGVVPLPGLGARPAHSVETEQSAKLDIGDTGTSLVAGERLSSSDDKWLHKVGAEQKLSGDVSISGSVGETPQGATSKSISAGFKRSW